MVAAILDCRNFNFLIIGTVTKIQTRLFDFRRWRRPLSWIFEVTLLLTVRRVYCVKLRHPAKSRGDRWNRGLDIAIFGFFKLAAAAILNF